MVPLGAAHAEMADMRTVVIIGSSLTRLLQRPAGALLYTPRATPRVAP